MTYYRGGLRAFGRTHRGGLSGMGATQDDVLMQAESIRNEAEGRGFRVTYFSGPMFWVSGIPAVAGSNIELAQKNAANTAQMDAWNAQLKPLWEQLGGIRTGLASVTVIQNPWGSAGKPVPNGYTINYGDLFQRYQQAIAAENWTEADRIAREINAITAAGPVAGGYVPVTGSTPEGDPLTPGPGIVYGPEGVTTVTPTGVTVTPLPVTPTDGSTEGSVPVPAPAPVQPTPVLVPTKSSGSLTPIFTTGPGGGGAVIDVTKPPTTKPGGGGGGALPGDAETGAQAGAGSGAFGVLAVVAIGLALLRRKR